MKTRNTKSETRGATVHRATGILLALGLVTAGLGSFLGTTMANAGTNRITFTGSAKKAGTIKVKVTLVKKADGQPAGDCEVSVGIVPGEDQSDKALKVSNALNNPALPCASLIGSANNGNEDTLTPDAEADEIQDIQVTDELDKAAVLVNNVALVSAIGRVRLDGIGGPGSDGALCSVTLPNGITAAALVEMAGLPGDVVEQMLAAELQAHGVNAYWNGDLAVDFGPVMPWESAGIDLDFSTEGPGFGPGSFVGLQTSPEITTPIEETSWGKVKAIYR